MKADRWTARRKRMLIEDVRGGTLALEAALEAHGVTPEEYQEWQDSYDAHGYESLKATKLQRFRLATRHVWVRKGHRA